MSKISPDAKEVLEKQKDNLLTKELENGPLEKRSCRDILCALIWLASVAALIAIFSYGINQGHPEKLAQPYDIDSNQCGESSTVLKAWSDYKYLYYMTPYFGYLTRTICVKHCPNWQQSELQLSYLDCKTTSSQTDCTQRSPLNVNLNNYTNPTTMVSFDWDNSVIIYNSTSLFDRVCVPSFITNLENTMVTSALSSSLDTLSKWISDIKLSWKIILASTGVAFIFGFLYLAVIKYIAGVIVWAIILLYFLITGALGFFFYYNATQKEDEPGQTSVNQDSINTNKAIGYAFWGLDALSLFILCCFYQKIRLAIAIVKTAACYVRDVKASIFVPVMNIIILVGFWAIWLLGLIYVYSVGDIQKSETTSFSTVKWKGNTRYMVIYYLFGGIWKNAFIIATCQFILASSVCIWYFAQGTGGGCHRPIRLIIFSVIMIFQSRSFYRAFRYHLGSIAFGSLILAIVQFIRLCLVYLQHFCEKNKLTENKFIKFIIWCSQCCLAYLERFIKFLNRNVYIQIALSGKSFCGAAKDAFCLIIQHAGRFAVVLSIGQIFVFFGKLFICLLGTLFGYLILAYQEQYKDKLYSIFLPTLVMFVLNYAIGCLFMSVYSMAIDAILHCFILDEELSKKFAQGGTRHSPQYLEQFIDKLNNVKQ